MATELNGKTDKKGKHMTAILGTRSILLWGALLVLLAAAMVPGGGWNTPAASAQSRSSVTLQIGCPQTTVEEGDSFTVRLEALNGYFVGDGWFSGDFSTDPGTAGTDDYHPQSGVRVRKHVTQGSFAYDYIEHTVETKEDFIREGDETFTVRFDPEGGWYTIYPNRCVITIKDDDHKWDLGSNAISPTGIWSNGTETWIADSNNDTIRYFEGRTAKETREFHSLVGAGNNAPHGIWSDGEGGVMSVVDYSDDKVYGYNMNDGHVADRQYNASKDINTLKGVGNEHAVGIWGNSTTLYVSDHADNKIYAYSRLYKSPDQSKDIPLAAGINARGIWSNGTVIWVADSSGRKLWAYDIESKAHVPNADVALHAENTDPMGVWADGFAFRVVDRARNAIYFYDVPFTNVGPPAAPGAPSVSGSESDETTLTVEWAPAPNEGNLPIINYDVRYRQGTSGAWTDGPQQTTSLSHELDNLVQGASYQVQVRSRNARGAGSWSNVGLGVTGTGSYYLVSNTAEGNAFGDNNINLGNHDALQQFTTGSHSVGYILTKVEVMFSHVVRGREDSVPAVGIFTDSNGVANAGIVTLESPSHLGTANSGLNVFSSPGGVKLNPDTKYWIIVDSGSNAEHGVRNTTSSGQAGAPGWSLQAARNHRNRELSGGGVATQGLHIKMRVYGYAVSTDVPPDRPDAPTLSSSLADASRMAVEWRAPYNPSGAAMNYDVRYRDGTSGAWTNGPQRVTSLSQTLSGLEAGSSYQAQVRARNEHGTGPWSHSGFGAAGFDPDVLVTNTANANDFNTDLNLSTHDVLQQFTTGSNALGYVLTGVDIQMRDVVSGVETKVPTVGIFTDLNGKANFRVAALESPSRLGLGNERLNYFSSPGGVNLDPDTKYWVLVDSHAGAAHLVFGTAVLTETGEANWSIRDTLSLRDRGVTGGGAETSGLSVKMRLHGYAKAEFAREVSGLTVSPVPGEVTRLRASWDSAKDADEYRVEWKTGSGSYTAVARSDPSATNETIEGLTADTTYTVKVTLVDSGTDVTGAEASGTTLAAMGAVGVSQVGGSVSKLSVSWPAVNGAAGYQVEVKSGNGPYSAVSRADATATSETITGLTANTAYTVKVTARHTIGGQTVDGDSAEGIGTTLDAMATVGVSPVPGASDELNVSWPAVNGATGYRVEWKTGSGAYSTVTRSDDSATTETITGLDPETTYTVRVTARHTIGGQTVDGDSAEGTGSTGVWVAEDPGPWAAPDLSVSSTTGDGVWFVWDVMDRVDGAVVTSYTIEWASDPSGTWTALNYPGDGRYCVPKLEARPDTDNPRRDSGCLFKYTQAVEDGDVSRGDVRYFRLVAHAGDFSSPPGRVLRQQLGDVGGL